MTLGCLARPLIIMALVPVFALPVIPTKSWAGSFISVPGLGASQKTKDKKASETVKVPDGLAREKVDGFVARLDDDQVRRLLIDELRQAAAAQEKGREGPPQPDGITRIIQVAGETAALLHDRIDEFTSDAQTAPAQLSDAYKRMGSGGDPQSIPKTILFAALLLAAVLIGSYVIRWRKAGTRGAYESSCPLPLSERAKRQGNRALADAGAVLAFAVLNLVLYFIFLDDHGAGRLMFLTYLGLMLLVCAVYIASTFVLSPKDPALRLVSLDDAAAAFIHRWATAISVVMGIGLLITVFLELTGTPERLFVLIDACTGLVVFLMLLFILVRKREPVSRFLAGTAFAVRGTDADSPRRGLYWYAAAIFYFFATWCLWVFYLLLGRAEIVVPVFALLSAVPLFLILNRVGQRLLDAVFGLIEARERPLNAAVVPVVPGKPAPADQGVCETDAPMSRLGKFIPVLRRCLSVCIAVIVCFLLLYLWGFNVRVGETIMSAALEVLFVVTLSYVAWKLIEGAINRRLAKIEVTRPDDEEERDGGVEGGSRAGTLLHLLRKFLFIALLTMVVLIVLSAIGIDIAPLLAGAGILGLAIGFGTQTLVKDIVSGVFFLIDDAFRIGDYVDTGRLKGTVEHISIRSLQLRHTRGMIHTIPFSDLKSVTNYSRDYNIEKIDVRVPFDTDVDKVRKILKKINKELADDEELGSKLLAPVKSQGVREVDDSALIIRIKFKTRPGDQYAIKREIFTKLMKAFDEKGIQFAHRHVIVRLPEALDGRGEGPAGPSHSMEEQLMASGAAAAVATALAEEEMKKRKEDEESEKS